MQRLVVARPPQRARPSNVPDGAKPMAPGERMFDATPKRPKGIR